jgi:DNA-binding MarR family transcriptional regulator
MVRYALPGRCILVIDKYFKLFLRDSLLPHSLTAAEGLILLALYGGDGKTQEQIIDELHFDKGVMTRMTKSLENSGFVVRSRNAADNRSFFFHLTDAGVSFKPVLTAILQSWSDIILQGVDDDALDVLNRTLQRMSQNVKDSSHS